MSELKKEKSGRIFMEQSVMLCRTCLPRIAVVLVFTALIEWFYFGFNNIDFMAQISNEGDGLGALLSVKNILTGSGELKGWPFFEDHSDYSAQYSMLYVLFVRFCGLFTKNVALVFNLYLFVIPLFNVLVCYLVLRHFKIRDWLAWLAALTFGFCPYVQYRLRGHMTLSAVECIPFVFMLCIWCVEDPTFNRPGKKWFTLPRNWAALFFTWMIANNGMVYYPFFSCAIFCMAALFLLLQKRSWRALLPPLMLVIQTAGWLAIGFLPTVWGIIQGYGNMTGSGVVRSPGQALIYSLQLHSLLLSPKGFGIPIIQEKIEFFKQLAANVGAVNNNEAAYAYMGVTSIFGFILLLILCFFSGRTRPDGKNQLYGRLRLLSGATVGILLISMQSGLGTIINCVVVYIRCYNRMSPFLVFCGTFAVALCAEALLQRIGTKDLMVEGALLSCAVIMFFVYGLWEQQGYYGYFTPGYGDSIRMHYEADKSFVSKIEQDAGAGAMIFQLPYMRSSENGPVRNIPDYDHMRGLFYGETLRWSYGATGDSENDLWYKSTSQLESKLMVEELYHQGFSGIWLNLDGYETEEGAELKAALCAAAHCAEPILCEDGHTIYISLSDSLHYRTDFASGEISEISYIATPETISTILDELGGDAASIQYLQNILQSNGMDGEAYTIALPSDGIYQVHYKTPEEKGEMRSVATLLEESNFSLADVGEHQLVAFPITIKEDTMYKVELEFADNLDFSTAAGLVVDFYAGPEYDRAEQEANSFVQNGRYRYTFYFNSGLFPGYVLDCQARVFVWNLDTVIEIDRFSVTEMEY